MKNRFFKNFRDSTAYLVARKINRLGSEIRKEIEERKSPENAVITLRPERDSRGRVLFSYIIDAFLLPSGEPISKSHTNFWQSWQMAQTFVELGYEVDVIHWTNHRFLPKGNYSIFVDVRRNLERLGPLLNEDCIKIMHIDTAHILFHNAAEAQRLLQLQTRRGITLLPRRFEMPNLGIEHADYATATGNDFVVGTFKYSQKKIFKLPSPCGITLDWPKRDWGQCRGSFLWFSSGALVHKGLDLALEAFAEMPEFRLIVCAPLERERAFVRAYYKELYETPNIKTVGWVDVDSAKFREITASCGFILHLSCSEGGAPSVKTCMHGGLVPIVSYQSGIDVDDYGYSLTDCSIENIKNVIRSVAELPPEDLEMKARGAWEFARQHYTRENFTKEYRRVILEILNEVQTSGKRE